VCEACTRPDCGECEACLDKPNFGGPNVKKRRCDMRVCQSMVPAPAVSSKLGVVVPRAPSKRGKVERADLGDLADVSKSPPQVPEPAAAAPKRKEAGAGESPAKGPQLPAAAGGGRRRKRRTE
jgi:histone-lysine N-methyltransferase MLL4